MNNLNSLQFKQSEQPSQSLNFNNIHKDFELREILEKKNNYQSSDQMDNIVQTLPFMNDNIRANIMLGVEIYKQLNNFDHNYIHKVINEKSKNSK